MKRTVLQALAVGAFILVSSCKENNQNDQDQNLETDQQNTMQEATEISIEPLENSPKYLDASLSLQKPDGSDFDQKSIAFDFSVENYNLGEQTDSPLNGMLASSDKGQHIHLIVDNEPYSAHYQENFSKDFSVGIHHVVAFLSRSYHESVKNENAFVARTIRIGNTENIEDRSNVDFEKPTLIYSRPKGEYTGRDTENLLLDFYLLNTTLAPEGNQVKATINGEAFTITEWRPYVIKGLPKGKVTIRLELLDAEGNPLEGEYNDVTREVMLK